MDVMIDLETMGNGPTAAIASIGAVAFDPTQPTLTIPNDMGEFAYYSPVDLQSCQQLGLTLDASTVYFWLQQSEAARNAIILPEVQRSGSNAIEAKSLPNVLTGFNTWLKSVKPERVWAWPPTFDLVILRSAYRACDIKPAWHYTEERCLRTLLDTVTGSPKYPDDFTATIPDSNVAHNALWDAWRQATLVQYCTRRLAQYQLQS